MPIQIDQMVTDVKVDPEPERSSGVEETRWDQADRLARMLQRNQMLERRTRAEGFDD